MISQVELFDRLDEWRWKKADKANIAIIGKDKSTLALSLLGRKLPDEVLSSQSYGILNGRLEGIKLTIQDASGLEHDPVTSLRGTHMEHGLACSAWIFTIPMEETRFESNSPHIILMKNITRSFGKEVWNRATIVLTSADIIACEVDPPQFEEKVKLWTDKVHEYLHQEEVASSVPVIAAGSPNKPLLTTDPEGTSWLNDIWLKLLLRSRCHEQPYIIKFVLKNLFKGPVTSGKQLVNFMKSHYLMYTEKAKELEVEPASAVRAVKACSFWHALGSVLHNHFAMYPHSLSLCQSDEDNCLLSYWQNITPTVNILVAGERGSGKTALVNSIFYGKKVIDESSICGNPQSILSEKPIEHYDRELAIEMQVYYSTLFNEKSYTNRKFNIIFYCISIYEDKLSYESNIHNFTDCFGKDVWKKTVIVMTFSNCLDSSTDFETEMKARVETLQSFFQNYLGENVVLALAGYHNKVSFPGDPKKAFWCIDLWMKAIPVAQTNSHSALITWLHTNTLLHKTWKMDLKKSSPISSYYKSVFIDMLYSIVETHKLY